MNWPFSLELIDTVFALVLTRKQQTMEANPLRTRALRQHCYAHGPCITMHALSSAPPPSRNTDKVVQSPCNEPGVVFPPWFKGRVTPFFRISFSVR